MSLPVGSGGSAEWNRLTVFRETFLSLRLPKQVAIAARVLGWLLSRESQRCFPEPGKGDAVRQFLLAAARDLRFLEGFLKDERPDISSEPWAASRVLIAHQVAESLSQLAGTLEAASR